MSVSDRAQNQGQRAGHPDIHDWPYEETNKWYGLKMSKNDTENVPNDFSLLSQ